MPRVKKEHRVRAVRGHGHVKRLPNGWCRGRIVKDGQSKTFTLRLESEVRAAMAAWQPVPVIKDEENPLVGSYLEQWWAEASPKWKATTLQCNANRFAKYVIADEVLGAVRIKSLSKLHIKQWLKTAFGDASDNTRYVTRALLCRALSDAVKDELIATNPARMSGLSNAPEKSKASIEAFEESELEKIRQFVEADACWRALVAFAFDSGARQAEVFGIQARDFDFARGTVSILRTVDTVEGKPVVKAGGKSASAVRTFDLTSHTLELVKRLVGPDAGANRHIFTDKDGKLWTRSAFRRAWRKVTDEAGVRPLGFHSTRHTTATILVSAGTPPNLVAARLGHKDASVTLSVYGHAYPKDQHKCAAVMEAVLARKTIVRPEIQDEAA